MSRRFIGPGDSIIEVADPTHEDAMLYINFLERCLGIPETASNDPRNQPVTHSGTFYIFNDPVPKSCGDYLVWSRMDELERNYSSSSHRPLQFWPPSHIWP